MNSQKKIFLSVSRVVLTILFLFITGCSWIKSFFSDPIVTVNGAALSLEVFSDQLSHKARQYDALNVKNQTTIDRLKEEVISQFIVDTLIEGDCEKRNISVSREEVDKEVDSLRSKYPDDDALRRLLAQEGLSLKQWSHSFEKTLLKKKLIATLAQSAPSLQEEDLKRYYDTHKEHFSHEDRAHIRQIVLARESDAERIIEKLRGGQKFDVLAKEYSIAPEKENAGDIGWMERGVLEVFDKAFALKPGQFTEVLKSDFGFHIIELIEKESAKTLSFEQAKAKIREILLQKQESEVFSAWMEEQLRKAKVLRNDQLIRAVHIQTKSF